MKHKFSASLTLALILAMLVTAVAMADTIQSDGDIVTPNIQTTVNLGNVAPGATLYQKISFQLSCDGNKHVDNGQSVILSYNASASTVPAGGSLAASQASIGAIPSTWPDDGNNNCTGSLPIGDNGDSTVTIVAPSTGGTYSFVVAFSAVLSPAGINDPASITGAVPTVTYTLTVASNTTPSVIVTGVTNGASYEIGSVPAATCQVTDAEDGNKSFSATYNAVAGPLSAYGLGDQTASCSYTDAGGLNASASVTYTIVDTTAPVITLVSRTPANVNGWNNSDVSLTWSCSDSGSGVVNSSVSQTVNAEGANQSAAGVCEDHAGNAASDTQYGINIDKTAPTASASASPAPNVKGWNNTDVTVSFSGFDPLSGIASCDPDVVLSVDGAGQSASSACTDLAGNVSAPATASGINIDKTVPVASASVSPIANFEGWNNTPVTVSFSGDDGTGSGVDFCDAAVVLGSEGAGQSGSGTCTDNAENVSTPATASGINIDMTPPAVALLAGPEDGASYYFGLVPAPPTEQEIVVTDVLSGPYMIEFTGYDPGVGTHTMTVKAYDKAGNMSTLSRTYTVLAWTLNGFYKPVDMSGMITVWNTVKGGSTVPLKFEVFAGLTELTDIAAVKSMSAVQVSCTLGWEDTIETISPTGSTTLRYDWTDGQFIYNWQTPKKPGNCYKVTMTTQDGSNLAAFFKLK